MGRGYGIALSCASAAAHSVLILRSPPKAGVSKDGRVPWFETRSFAALLTMRAECVLTAPSS